MGMKIFEAIVAGIISVIIAVIATGAALIWFSITWPWYLWRFFYRAAHPR